MADHRGVVELDALVDLALLAGRQQHADGRQARRCPGAHGGLHVFGDAVLEGAHVDASSGKPMKEARSGVPRGLCQVGRMTAAQYSFLGSCMLRTRLKWRFTAAAFLRLRSAVGFS